MSGVYFYAVLFHGGTNLLQICVYYNGHLKYRAHSGTQNLWIIKVNASLGKYNAVGSCCMGCANNGAEISGVVHFFGNYIKAVF